MEDKMIIKHYKQGVSVTRIARESGRKPQDIYNLINNHPDRLKIIRARRQIKESVLKKAAQLYREGYTIREIEDKLGVSGPTIYNYFKEIDLAVGRKQGKR